MKLKKTLFSVLLLSAAPALADISIDIPRGVQLLTVNGEDAGYSSLGFDYQDNLTLKDGVNQIVFRLANIVRESGGQKTKFKSEPLVATFDAENTKLVLKVPKIETFDQGMKFNNSPTFQLIDSENIEPPSLKKGQISIGFKLMPDMVHEVEKYNMSKEIASLKNFSSSKNTTSGSETESSSSYEVLRNAYENATLEEKRKFLTWAISNLE
ncbi:DUF2057 domain-containing protein [Vibrio sp. 05-20-BW147]|uniref:DUF2057 family protein n=1 Tax=Vibrio sp. 05-20-BW147 TaxID=2575834 RepID=UPI0015930031|nr:DUF2057 family protein [Vibrio sp. 05-20-BW147]NVC63739.1 DUF2057 domain-containing protein [Vibrio sp. 05-20-BW147]